MRTARFLSVLAVAGSVILVGLGYMTMNDPKEKFLGVIYIVLGVLQLPFCIWLNNGITKGIRAAWTGQIVFSCLGLLGFPIGT